MEMVRTHRWTRREYARMGEASIFHPEAKTELIDGEIVENGPLSSYHATAIRKVEEVLRAVFRIGYDVRGQLPLGLSDRDEPEPDVAVVMGHFTDYAKAHPTSAVLVVEVSNSTLVFDRGRSWPSMRERACRSTGSSTSWTAAWRCTASQRARCTTRSGRPDLERRSPLPNGLTSPSR